MRRSFLSLFLLCWGSLMLAQNANDSVNSSDNSVPQDSVVTEAPAAPVVEPAEPAPSVEPAPAAAEQPAEAEPEESPYDGVLNVIGDSYVRNHKAPMEQTWHYKMAEQLNLEYNNYGRNGSCLAWDRTRDGKHNFGPAVHVRVWDMESNADYVLVIGGHNDAFKINDNKHKLEDFRDSLELLISNIRQQCPKAKIGFVTPWYVNRVGFEKTCKVIKQVCDKHYIPVLWNHSKKSIIQVRDPNFRREYFQAPDDYAHLNEKGHDLYLPYAKAWFERYMMGKKPNKKDKK